MRDRERQREKRSWGCGKEMCGMWVFKERGLWFCGVIVCWVVSCDGFVGLEFWNRGMRTRLSRFQNISQLLVFHFHYMGPRH